MRHAILEHEQDLLLSNTYDHLQPPPRSGLCYSLHCGHVQEPIRPRPKMFFPKLSIAQEEQVSSTEDVYRSHARYFERYHQDMHPSYIRNLGELYYYDELTLPRIVLFYVSPG